MPKTYKQLSPNERDILGVLKSKSLRRSPQFSSEVPALFHGSLNETPLRFIPGITSLTKLRIEQISTNPWMPNILFSSWYKPIAIIKTEVTPINIKNRMFQIESRSKSVVKPFSKAIISAIGKRAPSAYVKANRLCRLA
jgi:hypothetical protein